MWQRWRSELMHLERVTIPRCYKPADFDRVARTELHHFSDASTQGYGQCSYLRLVDIQGRVHCAFVMGKSRVTPLKPITIPRLELTAAVCSVRVADQINRELDYEIDENHYWTDSKVALGYINNESRRFHVFVSNRVQEIRDKTSPDQWSYVGSKENPADEASRGMNARELPQSRWLRGPAFLWEDRQNWQTSDEGGHEFVTSQDDPEVKRSVVLASTTTVRFPDLAERVEQFSDWHRAKRAVALCIKYVKILRNRVNGKEKEVRQASVQDLEAAGAQIIRSHQAKSFQEEIDVLKRDKKEEHEEYLKGSSVIYKLDPFLDNQSILRVGGRLRKANLSSDVKHPVVIARGSHVATLIVRHYHMRTGHQGKGITHNEVRANGYWIIGGVSAVNSAIRSCVLCRKLRGSAIEQKMSNLPKDRLDCHPPFTYCAVDYFGPFLVKEGRKELKRYGVLFTCMASRAIHLETATSLETDSFLHALRRFLCRRGPVRQIRSDRGTNFVGAQRELKEALAEMDHNRVKTEMEKSQCDWVDFNMNVPSASHMGGVWERQIRTVRSVLSSLMRSNSSQLDDESLRTLMCEVECIVNSRPLTLNQLNDPDSPEPLTPNHLLTMKSKVLLAPPGSFEPADVYARKRWRRIQHLANEFWTRWRKEFLLSLQERQKWSRPRKNLSVGDVVLVMDGSAPRNMWHLARVVTVYPSSDGRVRKAKVTLADEHLDRKGKRTSPARHLERPVQKLVFLMSAPENGEIPVGEPKSNDEP